MEVELVVASADNDVASLLGEVGDTGVELEIAVVLEGLRQADELRAEPGSSAQAATAVCAGTAPSQHPALPYLLLGDFFLQGLQLPVLLLVDEDPSMLDV